MLCSLGIYEHLTTCTGAVGWGVAARDGDRHPGRPATVSVGRGPVGRGVARDKA